MNTPFTWLLNEKQNESGASDLRAAITAIGDEYRVLSRRVVRHDTEEMQSLYSRSVLAYGSIEFVKAVRSDFYPGKWCDWTALRCERYYSRLGELLLNQDYILLPTGEVRRRSVSLFRQWERIFLRPVRADKPFSGFVATREQSNEAEERLQSVEAHELVVLAEAKNIDAEYRTVVVRNQGIVAVSQYMREGQFHLDRQIPEQARQIAEAVVKTLGADFPDPMYVVDVAAAQGEYRLLEINGFSFASFYACDLEAIVHAAHREALREWQEMQI